MSGIKLFVYGVSASCPKGILEKEFERYGMVSDVFITGKGYAFITMESKDEAEDAVDALNGKKVDGQDIKVEIAVREHYFLVFLSIKVYTGIITTSNFYQIAITIYNSMEKVLQGAVTVGEEEISEIETDVVMAEVGVLETEIETVIVVTEVVVRDLMEATVGKELDIDLFKTKLNISANEYIIPIPPEFRILFSCE